MAFVVEDGTGLSNSNSFVDSTYADGYFTDRGVTEWGSLTNKEELLIRATDYIQAVYSESFIGELLKDSQALCFPRVVANVTVFYERVKYATCELALKANTAPLMPDIESKTIEETVGPITVKYSEYGNQKTQYTQVYNLLKPYLIGGINSKKVLRS